MKIIYNNKDIYSNISVSEIQININIGDILDSISVIFCDTEEMWTKYQPKIKDTLEIQDKNFTTGKMHIDTVTSIEDGMIIKALPITKKAKIKKKTSYENISMLEIAKTVANSLDMNLIIKCDINFSYKRCEQINISDLSLLKRQCNNEGLKVKIYNNQIIIYNFKNYKTDTPLIEISRNDMIEQKFYDTELYSSCRLSYLDTIVLVGNSKEDILDINNIAFYTLAEGERYAKNILDKQYKKQGNFKIPYDLNLNAGNAIKIVDYDMYNGNYIILESEHLVLENITTLEVALW